MELRTNRRCEILAHSCKFRGGKDTAMIAESREGDEWKKRRDDAAARKWDQAKLRIPSEKTVRVLSLSNAAH